MSEKFINPGVLKVANDYDNKTFVLELCKIFRSSTCKWAVKNENFEKKIHGTVNILGWSKKQHCNGNGPFRAEDLKILKNSRRKVLLS
jgi:hypothetical protein